MTAPRKQRAIVADNTSVKDGINVGDVMIFKRPAAGAKMIENVTAGLQGLTQSNESKAQQHTESIHAAVVVGKSLDGMPIISHVIGGGNKTERLDCSIYKYHEFDSHSVKNGNVRMEIAAMADQQPQATQLLQQTSSRVIAKNSPAIQQELKASGLQGREGLIYQTRSGEIPYSMLKAAQAGGAAVIHSSTLTGKANTVVPETPNFSGEKYNIGADEANKNKVSPDKNQPEVKFNDSQFCVSLVILAVQKAEGKFAGDTAVQYANAQLENAAKEKALSAGQTTPPSWNKQLQELQIENRTSIMLPGKLNELLSNANAIIDSNSSGELRTGVKAQETVGLADKKGVLHSSTSMLAATMSADPVADLKDREERQQTKVENASPEALKQEAAKSEVASKAVKEQQSEKVAEEEPQVRHTPTAH